MLYLVSHFIYPKFWPAFRSAKKYMSLGRMILTPKAIFGFWERVFIERGDNRIGGECLFRKKKFALEEEAEATDKCVSTSMWKACKKEIFSLSGHPIWYILPLSPENLFSKRLKIPIGIFRRHFMPILSQGDCLECSFSLNVGLVIILVFDLSGFPPNLRSLSLF